MAQKEALYGSRFRDADVRLLILRREAAAAGQLRRRGGFAADDALPRPSTWHKLGGRIREQICEWVRSVSKTGPQFQFQLLTMQSLCRTPGIA